MDLKPALYGLELEELETLAEEAGAPRYRGRQLAEWIYKKQISELKDAKTLPAALCETIEKTYVLESLNPEASPRPGDEGSHKYIFKTREGHFLESVLISQRGRRTVCVSTQLGCKIGCTFCASGKGRFVRNLTAGEIIEQIVWIQRQLGERASNVVFMGMGEPLDNFEATMKALRILQAPWGFGMGARHITVSTSGLTPKIVEFVRCNEGRVRLSVSLHSSLEAKRSELVPINKRYPLKELIAALKEMNKSLSRKITFEYTLIKGENDSDEELEGLAGIARPLKALINIIPYNPIREMEYERPDAAKIKAFRTGLVRRGVRVIVRQTAGRDIDAACGQLRLDRESGL